MTRPTASSLLVLTEGRFGQAVAERVATSAQVHTVLELRSAIGRLDELLANSSFVALALWRRYPSATDTVDRACARHGVPWSSATLDARSLVIGPVVVPGVGACHACYRKRWLTHLDYPEREQALDAAYEADPDLGCKGFLPSSATIAAAGLELDRADLAASTGRIRMLDLVRGVFEETRVVRVHGCDRCGTPDSTGERFVRHLRTALGATAPW